MRTIKTLDFSNTLHYKRDTNMKKYSIVIISILLTVIIFGGVFFGVLRAEEVKRQEKEIIAREEFLRRAEEIEKERQVYFESVQKKKEELRAQMESDQKQYENLLEKQQDIIADEKQVVTKVVNETVPITTTQTVTKPVSTKATKSS